MYSNFKSIPFVAFTIISSLISFSLTAQDTDCNLLPPATVYVEESDTEYVLDWAINDEASGYRVVVLDVAAGAVTMEEETEATSYIVEKAIVPEDGLIGIAPICWDNTPGEYGYFGPEGGNTIRVQDIVMQMQGESDPRTLECEEEVEEVLSMTFTGNLNTVFSITPPVNVPANYQVQGALIEITLTEVNSGNVFAQSSLVGLSNNTILNAANQPNLSWTNNNYQFVNPANQHFFSYSTPNSGTFDFLVNTSLPSETTYQLLVEQRNCPNVNKIKNGGSGESNFQVARPGASQQTSIGSQNGKNTVRLYPNPSTDYVHLNGAAEQIEVFNVKGQQVYRTTGAALPQQTITVSTWPAGLYVVKTTDADGQIAVLRFQKI